MIYDDKGQYKNILGVREDAIYTKPQLAFDEGNILIEALFPKLSKNEIANIGYSKFPITPSKNASVEEQEREIQLLHNFRIPLQHSYDLEDKAYHCLVNSYRQRNDLLSFRCTDIFKDGERDVQNFTMKRPLDGDGGTGLALLGIGGTGKTCSIKTMLSHWQQVIVHKLPQGTFIQVVWLKIEPSSNNDLSSLFNNFGRALDEALCNPLPTYENLLRKKRKVGEKAELIADLIRTFSVGILIIDEIQRLRLNRTRSESFENLMTITNNSKVAMLIAGTEEAYGMIFNKYYTNRRVGDVISTSSFCQDRKWFDTAMMAVMNINWFQTPQILNDRDILDAMFAETEGTIDRIVNVWKNIQLDYIHLPNKEKKNFTLTRNFIHASAQKHSPYMAYQTHECMEDDPIIRTKERKFQEEMTVRGVEKNQKIYEELSGLVRKETALTIYNRILCNLKESGEYYNESTIVEAIKIVFSKNSNLGKTDEELLIKALKKLRQHKQDKRIIEATTKQNTLFDLRSFDVARLNA